jgi:hypothetical protein
MVHYEYYNDTERAFVFNNYSFHHPSVRHQTNALTACIKSFGYLHDFVALIDVDEFIMLSTRTDNNTDSGALNSLPKFLRNFMDTDGLILHWRMFGSSGHINRPRGGVLRNYIKCYSVENAEKMNSESRNPRGQTKSITHTRKRNNTIDLCNAHECFNLNYRMVYVNSLKQANNLSVTFANVSLNHYRLKSKQDFIEKMKSTTKYERDQPVTFGHYWSYVEKLAVANCTDGLSIANSLANK